MIRMRMPAIREAIGRGRATPRIILRLLPKHDLRKVGDVTDEIVN